VSLTIRVSERQNRDVTPKRRYIPPVSGNPTVTSGVTDGSSEEPVMALQLLR